MGIIQEMKVIKDKNQKIKRITKIMNLEISLTKKSNLMESFMETDKILLILERRQAVSFFNYSNITIRNMRNNFKNTRNRLAHCN